PADVGAGAARDLERRLVARRLDDRVVAGGEQRVVEQEDALLGARGDDHVLGRYPGVDRGDRLAQLERPLGLRVAAPGGVEALLRVGLELEQLADRARLAVAAGQHVAGGELVARVEPLDPERLELHQLAGMMRRSWMPVPITRSPLVTSTSKRSLRPSRISR